MIPFHIFRSLQQFPKSALHLSPRPGIRSASTMLHLAFGRDDCLIAQGISAARFYYFPLWSRVVQLHRKVSRSMLLGFTADT